ncbi:MAG: hypothetical protein WEB04_11200 [Dehalococcoidia bacterium]
MTDPLSSHAKRLRTKVRLALQKHLDRVRETSLAIPVLGPGSGGGAEYDKRVQIRDALQAEGHFAYFPEDELGTLPPSSRVYSTDTLEEGLFDSAEMIIMIAVPGGASHELEQITANHKRLSDTLVFIDRSARSSYVAKGTLHRMEHALGLLLWYEKPRDLDECNLLKVAMEEARLRQETKARAIANAKSWGVEGT